MSRGKEIRKVAVPIGDLLSIFAEDHESVITSEAKMDLAKHIIDVLDFGTLKNDILQHYTGKVGPVALSEFKEQHEVAYNLFTQIWGITLWR